MTCPNCGERLWKTHTEERGPGGDPCIWRRRECRACGLLVHTHERIVMKAKGVLRRRARAISTVERPAFPGRG